MTWFAVDDRFPTHAKVYELRQFPHHDSALALWLMAGAWCSGQDGHNFTGFVPSHMVNVWGVSSPQDAAQALVDVGLWEARDGGWWFHDWSVWNGPEAKHNRSKEQTRARQQAHRIKMCEEAGDDLTLHNASCPTTDMDGNPRRCPLRDSKRSDSEGLGKCSTQPDPSRPEVTLPAVTRSGRSLNIEVTPSHVTARDLEDDGDPLTPEFIALMTGRAVPDAV